MTKLLGLFKKGFLFIIIGPFKLAFFLIELVWDILLFFFLGFRWFISLFTKKSIFYLKEDEELNKLKARIQGEVK